MPRHSAWIRDLPRICRQLTACEAPWLDRRAIEEFFQVQPRRALQLLHAFGAERIGGALLVSKENLLRDLALLSGSPEAEAEFARRQRLARSLTRAHQQWQAKLITLPTEPSSHPMTWTVLPENVILDSQRLEIRFNSHLDLLSTLYKLVQTIAEDYQGFEQRIGASPDASLPT